MSKVNNYLHTEPQNIILSKRKNNLTFLQEKTLFFTKANINYYPLPS